MTRRPPPLVALALVAGGLLACGLAACAGRGMNMRRGIAHPLARDFQDFPGKYRGKVVRLAGLEAARVEITRPLVFTPPGRRDDEVVVHDGRSLATTQRLREGEVVDIVIDCAEGRTDRGNLLLGIERPAPPVPLP